MEIYNLIHRVYQLTENHEHFGDPDIFVHNFAKLEDAKSFLKDIVDNYRRDVDEDGEPEVSYDCEVYEDGMEAVCTNTELFEEAELTIEKNELK